MKLEKKSGSDDTRISYAPCAFILQARGSYELFNMMKSQDCICLLRDIIPTKMRKTDEMRASLEDEE